MDHEWLFMNVRTGEKFPFTLRRTVEEVLASLKSLAHIATLAPEEVDVNTGKVWTWRIPETMSVEEINHFLDNADLPETLPLTLVADIHEVQVA